MKIPEAFLGSGPVVAQRMRVLARGFATARPADEKFGKMVDSASCPNAWILLDQVNRREPGQHFHSYALIGQIIDATRLDGLETWFSWFLAEPWRFLSIAGEVAQFLLVPGREDLCREYLRAALRFGPGLEAVGKRFAYLSDRSDFSMAATGAALILDDLGFVVGAQQGDLFAALNAYLASQGR